MERHRRLAAEDLEELVVHGGERLLVLDQPEDRDRARHVPVELERDGGGEAAVDVLRALAAAPGDEGLSDAQRIPDGTRRPREPGALRGDAANVHEPQRVEIAVHLGELVDRELLGADEVDHDLLDRRQDLFALHRRGQPLARHGEPDQVRIALVERADTIGAIGVRRLERSHPLLDRLELGLHFLKPVRPAAPPAHATPLRSWISPSRQRTLVSSSRPLTGFVT